MAANIRAMGRIIIKNADFIALRFNNIHYHFGMAAGTEQVNYCH